MKSVCFYFQIHQPFRLKRYRFFDIGRDHYYYDDFANDDIITRVAHNSYIPMAETLLDMIENSGHKFKCAISITGTAIEQLQQYVPEFIDLLKKLSDTGCCEFLAETFSHSLASLQDTEEFVRQVKVHDHIIQMLFGQKPKVIRNTELIFDDDIACVMASMGYKGAITEGAKHILGWKSPDYLYRSAAAPKLKLLLKNDKLSDDISRNFSNHEWSEYPLTADKYIDWIAALPEDCQIVNLFMSMETFGEFQRRESGIFDFMRALPRFAAEKGISFMTPTEAVTKLKPVGDISVPYPMSWADEARDVSAWKGNLLQNEALDKLYSIAERVNMCSDKRLKQDWDYLQSSDHFYYMSTKNLADGTAHASFSPYESPYAAFTNYMNALADFIVRVEEQYPLEIENEELNSLLLTIRNQAQEIEILNREVKQLRNNILTADDTNNTAVKVEEKRAAKTPAKKSKAQKPAAPKAVK
ncbi:MAG: glycoside hydrolase family 57 protein [Muribaculaceae bacterium]|nr:glycoside hydrolase family 57 protein [Muribaculaceae bacterium]